MDIDQANHSYRSDPTFKTVVDTIEAWIHSANVTPGEVRAAAMLACIHFENRQPRRYLFNPDTGEAVMLDPRR
jgi:hypothetical protein